MPSRIRQARDRIPRHWRTGLWLVLLFYGIYLLVTNLFLNTAVGEQVVNRKPERFRAQWSWAMSLYPGHIHAHGLDMGGHGSAAAWRAQATSAHGRIALLPLRRHHAAGGIGRIVDDGEVRAAARVHVAGDVLVLDAIEARKDRIGLQARLRVADGDPSGDLYARWGVLGVGAELQGGRRKLHFAGARDWYASRPPLLPARKQATP